MKGCQQTDYYMKSSPVQDEWTSDSIANYFAWKLHLQYKCKLNSDWVLMWISDFLIKSREECPCGRHRGSRFNWKLYSSLHQLIIHCPVHGSGGDRPTISLELITCKQFDWMLRYIGPRVASRRQLCSTIFSPSATTSGGHWWRIAVKPKMVN